MRILAISGSAREASTNTALLKAIQARVPEGVELLIFNQLHTLPVFSPDLEGENTPSEVCNFIDLLVNAEGIIISSPEYVRAIPGGLKNAIDWMVSRIEIIGKPIALVHASHRGDDMLDSLRLVLATISENFREDIFLRIPLIDQSPEEVEYFIQTSEYEGEIAMYIDHLMTAISVSQKEMG